MMNRRQFFKSSAVVSAAVVVVPRFITVKVTFEQIVQNGWVIKDHWKRDYQWEIYNVPLIEYLSLRDSPSPPNERFS